MKVIPQFIYDQGLFLGNGRDMAHNAYSAYKCNDEIHIVYSNLVTTKSITKVVEDKEAYLWTPFIEWC